MDTALAAADWAGFSRAEAESERGGMLRGIGLSCFHRGRRREAHRGDAVRLEADGTVSVFAGTFRMARATRPSMRSSSTNTSGSIPTG